VTFLFGGGAGGRCGECGDGAFECAIEACGEGVSAEDVGEACVAEVIVWFGDGGECAECFGVGVDDVVSVDAEGGDAWAVWGGCDGGDGEGVGVMIEGEGAPVSCGGVVCEGGAESAGEFARVGGGGGVGVWGECGAEESHGAGTACDGGVGDECVDADGAAGVWRDSARRVEEAECVRDGLERVEGVGLGEQVGGGADGEHA